MDRLLHLWLVDKVQPGVPLLASQGREAAHPYWPICAKIRFFNLIDEHERMVGQRNSETMQGRLPGQQQIAHVGLDAYAVTSAEINSIHETLHAAF